MPRTRSILIVESGATKARWRYLSDGGVRAFDSPGINFSSMGAEEVGRRIAAAVKAVGADVTRPGKVVFYGAGLLSDEAGAFFPGSEVECASDLLAAARAVCGHKEGIAAILGTGSNSCHFDGEKIVMVVADQGPGIPNIDLAMQEGWSTASPQVREMGYGAGMGLPNIKKNTDELKIDTTVGVGTTVTMTVYLA